MTRSTRKAALLLGLLGLGVPGLFGLFGQTAHAADSSTKNDPPNEPPRRAYNRALEAFKKNDFAAAEKDFLAARDQAGPDDELRFRAAFNLGLTLAKKAEGPGTSQKPDESVAALRSAAAWFRDAIRLRDNDKDARVNLEIVLRRLRALADKVNQGENGLEARLDKVIEAQRGLRDQVRGLLDRLAGAADPLAFQGLFRDAATSERTLLSDAGTVAEMAAEEGEQLKKKPEAEQKPEDKARAIQLGNLGLYLDKARQTMASARHRLSKLEGERGHADVDAALRELKRAREQLHDPVTVLKGVLEDEAVLTVHTTQLAMAATAAGGSVHLGDQAPDKPNDKPAPPAWLRAPLLAARQDDLVERTDELLARLRAGVATESSSGGDGGVKLPPAASPAEERGRRRVLEAAAEAIPILGEGRESMAAAGRALYGDSAERARGDMAKAVSSLGRAIERFAGLRDVIELACGEQRLAVDLLTQPDAGATQGAPPLSEKDRATAITGTVSRNRERVARLIRLLADEKADQEEKAAAAKAQQGAQNNGPGNGNAQAPDPTAEQRQLFEQAERERKGAEEELGKLAALMGGKPSGAVLVPPAKGALERLEALRRLFFSIVEHLKELAQHQAETHDKTSTAAAQGDDTKRREAAAPLGTEQTRHHAMAQAIAQALSEQAEKAAAAPAPPAGQGQQGQQGPSPEEMARAMSQASQEVTTAGTSMESAARVLGEAGNAPIASYDLGPTLEDQKSALEHLQKAIALLQPPQQQQQQQNQQQQQQQQQDQGNKQQAERRMQELKEREAERRRRHRDHAPSEPVEKDW